ncbi:sugar ABC transporter substrate-binding protein [bacterium]|nr:sugar ABC transporter substrate-binding protein [bacterium]
MDANKLKEFVQNNKKLVILGGGALLLLLIGVIILTDRSNSPVQTVSKPKTPVGGDTTQTTSPSSGNIELVYWGLWEDNETLEELIEQYESENPGVKIKYSRQRYGSTIEEAGYEKTLYTRLVQSYTSSDEPAPDIFRIHNTWLPKYRYLLSELPSSIMTSSEYAKEFYPTAVEDFTDTDGKIYAIPLEIDGLVVFYNKKLLKEIGYTDEFPTDWNDLFDLATKLTKKDNSGQIIQAGLSMGGTKDTMRFFEEILYFFMLQEGMDIIDETRTKVTLNTQKGKRVLDRYISFSTGEDAVWRNDIGLDTEMFFSGKLAMLIAPSWMTFDIIEANSALEFDTAPLPQLRANNKEVYYSTYWGEAVSKNCKHPEEAWKFIKFLSEPANEKALYTSQSKIRTFGEPYSRVELNSLMVGEKYVDAIAKSANLMKSWQIGPDDEVKEIFSDMIETVIDGNDASSALSNAEKRINDVLAEYN